jgi:hypothetical protein
MDLNNTKANSTNSTNSTNSSSKNEISNFIFNPIIILIIFVIIVIFFSFSSSLGNNNDDFVFGDTSDSTNSTFLSIVVGLIILYILIKIIEFIYNIDISTKVYNFNTDKGKIDININDDKDTDNNDNNNDDKEPSTLTKITDYLDAKKDKYNNKLINKLNNNNKQVFNIPDNNYDYTSAKALCKAYNSDLATYNQVEESYEKGGEWCNYGWSEGQMALFPTQQATYDTLQKIEGHENDCGRPGINGGYIANPNVNFGVNCYGVKPLITQEESDLMKTMTPYPETEKDIEFQKQVNMWKNKINEILVSPFNYKSWTQG